MHATWTLVANTTQARIFTAESPRSDLLEIKDFSHEAGRLHDRDLTSDLPGKNKTSNGGGHAFEPPTDPKKHEADKFAHTLAKYLESAFNDGQYKRLIIVAEPVFLGLLRNCLADPVKKSIILEVDKNLSSKKAEDIHQLIVSRLNG